MRIESEIDGSKLWADVETKDIVTRHEDGAEVLVRFFDARPFLISFSRSGLDWYLGTESFFELQETLAVRSISPLYVMDLLEQFADKLWWSVVEPDPTHGL
jgi:hypothetical protein